MEGGRIVDGPDLPRGVEFDRGAGPARVLPPVVVFEEDWDGREGVEDGWVRVAEEGGEVERVDKVRGAARDGGVEEAVEELVPRWGFKVSVVKLEISFGCAEERGENARQVHVQTEVEVGVGNVGAAFFGLDVPQVAVPRPAKTPYPLAELLELRLISLLGHRRNSREERDPTLEKPVQRREERLVRRSVLGVRRLAQDREQPLEIPSLCTWDPDPSTRRRSPLRLCHPHEEADRMHAQLLPSLSNARNRLAPLHHQAILPRDLVHAVPDHLRIERDVGRSEQFLLAGGVDVRWVVGRVSEEEVGEGESEGGGAGEGDRRAGAA